MTKRATGTFGVTLKPEMPYNQAADAKLGRMSIDKLFHGDLEASSQGEMLSAGTGVKGSAGNVAIERVTGSLQGQDGWLLPAAHGDHETWRAEPCHQRCSRFRNR